MTECSKKLWLWLGGTAFIICAALYFYQSLSVTEDTWRWIIAVPTAILAIITYRFSRTGGILIPLALTASAIGDYYGSEGIFILQVAFFAAAHIFYIADLWPHKQITAKRRAAAGGFIICAAIYLGYIIGNMQFGIYSIAVGIYGVIIATMGVSAIIQTRKYRGRYIVAAALFVISDGIIAYGFVGSIPNATLWIMSTYYTAQVLFASLAIQQKK